MWKRTKSLIIKELLANLQDQQTRTVVLILPPLLMLVYVFALTQEVKNVSMAILNHDGGTVSRELISRFEGSPTFSDIRQVQSQDQGARMIENQTVMMVLQIQSDFSRKIAAGEPTAVQIILDGRRSNAAQILQGYVGQIVLDFNKEATGPRNIEASSPSGVVVARTFFNPNFDAVWSAMPGLFAVLVATVGFMVSALSVARERELGTFEQLLVSPLRPVEILIGKTFPALLIALVSAGAMLVLGIVVLDVPLEGSVSLLFAATTVYLAAAIGIGLFISSLASTQQQAITGLFMYMMPAVLLSGYATPIENMPDWLQHLTQTNPITHFIIICRSVFLKEAPVAVVGDHIWPLVLIALVTLSSGAWLFRRKMQ